MPRPRGENYKERKNPYVADETYPGVYTTKSPSHKTGKDEVVFYISYYVHGKRHFEPVESKDPRKKMNARSANAIRSIRMSGLDMPNTVRRQKEAAQKAASAGRWTFNRLWEAWKKDPEQGHLNEKGEVDLKRGKRGTLKADQRYKKHIKVPFGDREPKNVIIEDIDRLRLRLAKTHAKETTVAVIGLIKRIANYGAEKKLCPGLQFPIKLKAKALGREPREKKTPTDEMILRFIKTCREWPDKQAGNFLLLEYYTGMRRSSAWNLKWSDVDLDQGEILLPSTMTKSKKNILLRLTADAVSLLRSHPRTEGNPYVFTGLHPDGKRTERDVSVLHREIRNAAGIPAGYDPNHMWRVNLATQLSGAGVSTFYIQQAGGWSTPAMVDHYTKVQRDVLQDAVDVMSKVLQKAGGKTA